MLLVQTRISLKITFILLHDIDSDLQVKLGMEQKTECEHRERSDVQINMSSYCSNFKEVKGSKSVEAIKLTRSTWRGGC